MSHDQNFKNLILDYPREALAFLAEAEARSLSADVRITPVRQEQLKERLGERFRDLSVPLTGGMTGPVTTMGGNATSATTPRRSKS